MQSLYNNKRFQKKNTIWLQFKMKKVPMFDNAHPKQKKRVRFQPRDSFESAGPAQRWC